MSLSVGWSGVHSHGHRRTHPLPSLSLLRFPCAYCAQTELPSVTPIRRVHGFRNPCLPVCCSLCLLPAASCVLTPVMNGASHAHIHSSADAAHNRTSRQFPCSRNRLVFSARRHGYLLPCVTLRLHVDFPGFLGHESDRRLVRGRWLLLLQLRAHLRCMWTFPGEVTRLPT